MNQKGANEGNVCYVISFQNINYVTWLSSAALTPLCEKVR